MRNILLEWLGLSRFAANSFSAGPFCFPAAIQICSRKMEIFIAEMAKLYYNGQKSTWTFSHPVSHNFGRCAGRRRAIPEDCIGRSFYAKPVLVVMALPGMGSRYGGLKQLDPVGPGGQLIIDYSLFDAHRAGFETVIFSSSSRRLRQRSGRELGTASPR